MSFAVENKGRDTEVGVLFNLISIETLTDNEKVIFTAHWSFVA